MIWIRFPEGNRYNLAGAKIIEFGTRQLKKWQFWVRNMSKIQQIQEFLKKQPDDAFLIHALALEYIKAEDLEKARNLFEDLLGRQPDYVGSYYHLAGLLAKMGEKEQAIDWYEKGIVAAKKAGDQHALRELQSALEELVY